jgi:hypothetical protein
MSQETMSQDFPISFSQMEPDLHTSMAPTASKAAERNRLAEMEPAARSRLITDLSRHILFKSLSGDPIDRTKLAKEAFPDNLQDSRVTNASVEMAAERMQAIFGFHIKKVPDSIKNNKNIPNKYSDRLFVVNQIKDDEHGSHSKKLHGYHIDSSVEKGLLMLVLAFIYCKGEVKDSLRWLNAGVLYRLLHSVDENIPATPSADARNTKKRESIGGITSPATGVDGNTAAGVGLTPNVDLALERFVHMDYIVKKKFDSQGDGTGVVDEAFSYAIGPRALIVVGLKQIVHFCADILEQKPDPTMLQELAQEEEDAENLVAEQ